MLVTHFTIKHSSLSFIQNKCSVILYISDFFTFKEANRSFDKDVKRLWNLCPNCLSSLLEAQNQSPWLTLDPSGTAQQQDLRAPSVMTEQTRPETRSWEREELQEDEPLAPVTPRGTNWSLPPPKKTDHFLRAGDGEGDSGDDCRSVKQSVSSKTTTIVSHWRNLGIMFSWIRNQRQKQTATTIVLQILKKGQLSATKIVQQNVEEVLPQVQEVETWNRTETPPWRTCTPAWVRRRRRKLASSWTKTQTLCIRTSSR